ARVDGKIVDVTEPVKLDKKRAHDIELVVDRITLSPKGRGRLSDSVETSLKWGNGLLMVLYRTAMRTAQFDNGGSKSKVEGEPPGEPNRGGSAGASPPTLPTSLALHLV